MRRTSAAEDPYASGRRRPRGQVGGGLFAGDPGLSLVLPRQPRGSPTKKDYQSPGCDLLNR